METSKYKLPSCEFFVLPLFLIYFYLDFFRHTNKHFITFPIPYMQMHFCSSVSQLYIPYTLFWGFFLIHIIIIFLPFLPLFFSYIHYTQGGNNTKKRKTIILLIVADITLDITSAPFKSRWSFLSFKKHPKREARTSQGNDRCRTKKYIRRKKAVVRTLYCSSNIYFDPSGSSSGIISLIRHKQQGVGPIMAYIFAMMLCTLCSIVIY